MGFSECDKFLAANFFHLDDDNDTDVIMFVSEPMPRKGVYAGRPRIQYVFPVFTSEGLMVWTVGAVVYRQIRDHWATYKGQQVKVTRRGKKRSTETVYEFDPVEQEDLEIIGLAQGITEQELQGSLNMAIKDMSPDFDLERNETP